MYKFLIAIAVVLQISAFSAAQNKPASLAELAKRKFQIAIMPDQIKSIYDAIENGKEFEWKKGFGADEIRWLCTDPVAASMITKNGLRTTRAVFEKKVNLSQVKTEFPIHLQDCVFKKGFDFSYCEIPVINLAGSAVFLKSKINFSRLTWFSGNDGFFLRYVYSPYIRLALNKKKNGAKIRVIGKGYRDLLIAELDNISQIKGFEIGAFEIYAQTYFKNKTETANEKNWVETEVSKIHSNDLLDSLILLYRFRESPVSIHDLKNLIDQIFLADDADATYRPTAGLDCDGIVANFVSFSRATFNANLSVSGAQITNDLVLDGCRFQSPLLEINSNTTPPATAVFCANITVGGNVWMRGLSALEQEIQISGNIDGTLFLSRLSQGKIQPKSAVTRIGSLWAVPLVAKSGIDFSDSVVQDRVDIRGAKIGVQLDFTDAMIGSLDGQRMEVSGNMLFNRSEVLKETVDLSNAKIQGDLDMRGIKIKNPSKTAIDLEGTHISSSFRLSRYIPRANSNIKRIEKTTIVHGVINLTGTTILGSMEMRCVNLNNNGNVVLEGVGLYVGQSVYMENCNIEGRVKLQKLKVSDKLVWKNIRVNNNKDDQSSEPKPENRVPLDISFANIGALEDECSSWPGQDDLKINGIKIGYFISHNNPQDRIEWIRLQSSQVFLPEPYDSVANTFRKNGKQASAEEIWIAREKDRLKLSTPSALEFLIWGRVLGPLIGYGYKPFRCIWLIIAIVCFGSILFEFARSRKLFVACDNGFTGIEGADIADGYPKFNSLLFSIDAFIPLINFRQVDYWLPTSSQTRSLSISWLGIEIDVSFGGFVRMYFWLHIVMGWTFTTLFAVGVTGLIRQ